MKLFKLIMLLFAGAFLSQEVAAQANVSLNMLTLNSGDVIINGSGTLQITLNNTGPTSVIPTGKLQVQITVPTSISIPTPQTISGYTFTSLNAQTVNICNSGTSIPVGGASTFTIALLGGPTATTGVISGNTTFRTNCTAPGSLAGNNPADDAGTAGFQVVAGAACNITGASASAGTIVCNGGTTSVTVTATTSGSTGTLEYSIGGAFQSSATFTGVTAGSYTVTAREAANTACSGTGSVTVSQPTVVDATGSVTTPIPTVGGTGVITISATGGTPGYTGTGTFNRTAGTYSFTVTDANGCTDVVSVTINDPAACLLTSVSAAAGTILCNGGTTTITATPAGLTGAAVEYRLGAGAFQSSAAFTSVVAGTYTVTAREVSNPGCSVSTSVTVSQPTAVSATAAVSTPIAVPGGTGAITVTPTGGTGAYSFVTTSGTTINATGATSGIFSSLLAGSYTFTVTDANGCSSPATAAVNLANPGVATADPAVGGMYFTTTTGGVQNANTLLLAPSTALYDINIPFFNLNQVNQVPAGTINFTINLGKKLVLAPGFNLATAPLSAYFTWTSAVVGGNVIITGTQSTSTPIPADFNGIATFRVKGDSACRSNVVSNIVITNVLQSLNDDDLNNNSATLQYTLPITLTNTQVNVTCNGAGNGIINVTVSSGTTVTTTGPSYSNTQNIAAGVNTFTLSGLAPGTYTITATAPSDAPLLGCSISNTVIISQPTVLALPGASISHTNNNCFNAADGSITVVASGGTAPYVYTIAGPTVNTTGALNGIFTGLTAGSYTVTVTDNNGCTATTAAIVITQPVGGIPDITLGSDYSGNAFLTPGVTQTIVYNIAEIAGNSAVGDTLRITKVAGFTINFNPTLFSTVVGGTTYALDNTRWKIDNTDPAFVSIILTDPLNASNPGTLLCNQLVRVAVTLTRNSSDISIFPLSARLRRANGEVVLNNNLNSIVFIAE